MNSVNEPKRPPALFNSSFKKRQVGFELELSGISLERAAKIITNTYGGCMVMENRYIYVVRNTDLGNFKVELDFTLLRDRSFKKYLKEIGVDRSCFGEPIENLVAKLAKKVLPYEIVFPPVSVDEIESVDVLREALCRERALGTEASIRYAFGLHINTEVPSFHTRRLLDYLRAYFLLCDWLKKKIDVDFTRKVSTFITPFPDQYVQLVLDKSYTPSLDHLIDDYVYYSPTRNRPLDMLPIFAFLDKQRVFSKPDLDNVLIQPRPTFHYRLANSRVDDPSWTISHEWNYWVEIEKLAFHSEKLCFLSRKFLKRNTSLSRYIKDDWAERVEYWLKR